MAGKIGDGSGVTPPLQPTSSTPAEQTVGTLGSKKVTPHHLDENFQQGLQQGKQSEKSIPDRAVSYPPLKNETLTMIRKLVNDKQWEGVRNALDLHVKTLDHFDQLSRLASKKIPLEGQKLIANRYATLAADRVSSTLSEFPGSVRDQLEGLITYLDRPDHPHSAVKATCRAVADDFLQTSKFEPSLKHSLTDQMETRVLGTLLQKAVELNKEVKTTASAEDQKILNELANQWRLEIPVR